MTTTSVHAPTAAPLRTARSRAIAWDWVLLVAVLLVGASLPLFLPPAELNIAVRVLVFALMGIGWNIMSGFGGLFSFGHAAYFGIGSYAAAYLLVEHGISPWLGLLAGMVLSAAAAVGISYLAFRYRLQGAYYAMSTFAFAEMLRLFVTGNDALQRTVGFTVPVLQGSSLGMFQFPAGSPSYYWLGLLMVVLALAVSIAFVRSRAGRFTLATRDDELAASAVGIDTLRHKLTAVAISAAITAAAGVLYFQYYMFIDPDLAFGAHVSNNAIITAVVGGSGTVWGPLVGAVVMAPLSDLTAAFLREPPAALSFLAGHGGLDIVLYAVILIAFVILLPKGLYGTARAKLDERRSR
ncbi:branched-chain amino acid ABC transporter permease [Kineococcus arenarius]|uniref:branched-chain amino acid ABC transporter permease n=1 Tax=unclassified Kineococcus TaxID=2621656 RepID=UPI003D7EDC94